MVIGQPGWNAALVEEIRARAAALGGAVLVIPHCEDAELAAWLGHARALLFPSFDEGYGLPALEAAGLGVPLILSDLPAFREALGARPEFLPATDARGWEALVEEYALPASAAREAQCRRLDGFRPETWAAHFARLDSFLAERGLSPRNEGRVPGGPCRG